MSVKNYVHSACDNCNNFTMYFTKGKYGYFVAWGCGKCKIKEFTEEERTKLPYDFVCNKWEKRECADYKTEEIKNELRDISARILKIISIL